MKKAGMDDCEAAAKQYILHLGYKEQEVPYEPDGQDGPDFVIDGKIAVEVTRLNRHVGVSADGRRLGEESAIPVEKTVATMLDSLGPPTAGFSWFVSIEFTLPPPGKREIEREVRKHLKAFQDRPLQESTRIRIFDNLTIELCRAGRIGSRYFLMGAPNHDVCGEMVVEALERNVSICIDDKGKKLSYLRSSDRECWLALADHIYWGWADAWHGVRIPPHGWDRVILINPLDPTQSFELPGGASGSA
ncbi:MAG: hypothetical protein ABSH42_13500 [Bryobacteraceae bacterium]|jgi:hypothetical protein